MQTLQSSAESLTEVNRSKFYTYFVPIRTFERLQERLKTENPKANHVVYALRYLNKYGQVVENSSDDEEPNQLLLIFCIFTIEGYTNTWGDIEGESHYPEWQT